MYQPPGVTFTNVGTIDIQSNNYWGTSGSGAILDNPGTINKSAGTVTYIDSVFQNSGSVTVSAGEFRMRTNTTTTGSFTSTGSGVVNFESGTHDLLAASSVTGQNVSFTGNGTVTISGTYTPVNSTFLSNIYLNNGPRTLQNIDLQGRTMNGDSDLTISNQLTWTNGTIQRTGLTTLGSGATWTISGNPKSLDSDFRNEGTITWLSTAVYQPPGVTFTNVGTIDIQSNDYWGTSGSGAILDNQGTINKSAGNITYIDSVFTNSGSVNVSAGEFRMRTNTTTTGSFTSTGSGVVNFENGTHDLLAASSVTGQNVSFTGSGTADVHGTYSVDHTTVNKVVNLMPIAGTIGSITLQSGTLNPAPVLELHGDFTRTGGTYNHTGQHSGLRRRDDPGSQPFGNHCFHQPRGGPGHPARGDGGSRLLRRGGAGHQRRRHPQDQEHWRRHRDLRSDFSGDGRGQRGRPDQRPGGLDRLRPPRRLWRGVDRQSLAHDSRGIQPTRWT